MNNLREIYKAKKGKEDFILFPNSIAKTMEQVAAIHKAQKNFEKKRSRQTFLHGLSRNHQSEI